jgi:hypothetical protein
MESGLQEALMQNLNYVPVKEAMEYSTRSCCKTKKGVNVTFWEAINFSSDIILGKEYSHWKVDSEENDLKLF